MLLIYLLLIDVFFDHVSLISSCLCVCVLFFYELILYLFLCCKIGSLIRLLTISSNSHSHISYVFINLHLARVQRYTDEHLCQGFLDKTNKISTKILIIAVQRNPWGTSVCEENLGHQQGSLNYQFWAGSNKQRTYAKFWGISLPFS